MTPPMNLLWANDAPGKYPDSYYADNANLSTAYDSAKGQLHCDVCVVGGGLTGLSSAWHLARQGYRVIVLDAQRFGFGASGRNGGQVSVGQRLPQDELEKRYGESAAKSLWELSLQAVALVKEIAAMEQVNCTFTSGIVHADHRKRFVGHSHAYVDSLVNNYGYDSIFALNQQQLRDIVASDAYYGGSLDMGSGHIDPLQFALGFASLAKAAGVQMYEQSAVTEICQSTPLEIKTAQACIKAEHVVLACNGYLGDLMPTVSRYVMPINNYIIATQPMTPAQQHALIKNNYAVCDSKFVVNYFRFSHDHRLLFGGSESYAYRFPKDIARAVRKPMLQIFPQLKDVKIDYAWGGTLAITMNRMPYFHRVQGNILNFSGYSGHGVALATMAGEIAAQSIRGQAERFDMLANLPHQRFPGGRTLRSPLLALAMLWYSLRDKF